ncbi:MAG: hypothetical protein JWP27_1483 [Flaviaesturariibacter sp.]|nr:hypothetical protein [Flaviaesturariibacter sp.]
MSETFQQRLSRFEARPPEKMWEAIAAELDQPSSFAEKLLSYETPPPPGAWDAISAGLEQPATPVIPIARRPRPYLRYGAMAAAIFAAVILVNLVSKKAESDNVAVIPATKPAQLDTPIGTTAATTRPTAPVAGPRRVDRSIASVPAPSPAKAQANRYVTMANTSGQTVRLSRKVSPIIDCAKKTEPTAWSRCKENIQTLQARMATTAGGATGDFGGLMDMIKSLEENQ